MVTRVTFANGDVVDYDEERDAHPAHDVPVAVVSREYLGPAQPAAGETAQGESDAQKRDRLRAELAALGDGS